MSNERDFYTTEISLITRNVGQPKFSASKNRPLLNLNVLYLQESPFSLY